MAQDPAFRLPWTLRTLNRVGGLVGWPRLSADRLWDRARRATGAEPLPEAVEALGVLLDAAAGVPVTALGRLTLSTMLAEGLEHLLHLRAVPDDAPVLPPVVIASLPRSGTTWFHRLMSLHSAARWPRMWELVRPHPAPRHDGRDPRIALAEATARQSRKMMPEIDRIHPLEPEGPDECHWLFAQTVCCVSFDAQLPIPAYTSWFLRQDLRWTYRHHRRGLALLQRHVSGRFWLLKTPLHLFGLDALLETYPDARLIVIYREPREAAGSCASLYESARSVSLPEVDPRTIGAPWLATWGEGTDRAVDALARWPADRVAHVSYPEILRDPVGSVEAVVDRLGLPADPALAGRVAAWVADHPQHRHGAHRYTLQRYGLAPEQVDERFARWRALGARGSEARSQ